MAGSTPFRALVLTLTNGKVQRIGIAPIAESQLIVFLSKSNEGPDLKAELDRVKVEIKTSSWLRRVFEIKTPAGSFLVEFNGRRTGKDSFPILVDRKTLRLPVTRSEYGRRYQFKLGQTIGHIDVRTSPWMTLRTVELWLADRLLYSEGYSLDYHSPVEPPLDASAAEWVRSVLGT